MSKRRNYLVFVLVLFCAAQILSGCIAERTTEELPPQEEGTSGPIPIQVEPTDLPPTVAPTEGAAILPTDTPASSEIVDPTDTPEAVPDEPTAAPVIDETVEIQLDWDIYSVAIGESDTVPVQAVNSSGDPVPFSIQAQGNCLTAAFDIESITITAGDEMCEQIITVKASNAEDKTINVIVFDPMVLDIGEGLLIRYVNEYDFVWDVHGGDFASGNRFFEIWHPVAIDYDYPEGWFPLGSIFINRYKNNQAAYIPSIVIKDSKNAGLLEEPLDYILLDSTIGSGKAAHAFIWKAVCPADYVALGVIATGSSDLPSTDLIRCVHQDYTREATMGEWIWDTGGDDDIPDSVNIDWGFFSIKPHRNPYPEIPEGYAMLNVGTGLFCRPKFGDWSTWYCDQDPARTQDELSPEAANVLVVPLPVYKHTTNKDQPKWTSPEPFVSSVPRFHSAVRVPFTLIPDVSPECLPNDHDSYNLDDCQLVLAGINRDPFYYALYEENWEVIWPPYLNNLSTPITRSVEITKGFQESTSETTSNTFGIEVQMGGDVGFLGSGGSWSVSLNYQYSWEQTYSYTAYMEESETTEVSISPGKTMQAVQVISQFRLAHMDGSPVRNISPVIFNTDLTMFMEYPPPD